MSTRRTVRIVGFIIKTLFSLFVFAVCALVIWRVFFSTKIPESVETLSVNEPLANAYEQYGDDLILQYQNQFSLTLYSLPVTVDVALAHVLKGIISIQTIDSFIYTVSCNGVRVDLSVQGLCLFA